MAFNIINKLKHLIKEPKLDSNGFMIYAPISGEVIPITDVPDVVFSEKIAGDGVAITADNGIEVLIHFGIDTVELQGKGFTRVAEKGQQVKVGDPLIELDLEFLESNAKSTITPIVISNIEVKRDGKSQFGYYEGSAVAGVTQIMSIGIGEKSES